MTRARLSTYEAGLLFTYWKPYPAKIVVPKDFPLSRCYRPQPDGQDEDGTKAENVHLIAAG